MKDEKDFEKIFIPYKNFYKNNKNNEKPAHKKGYYISTIIIYFIVMFFSAIMITFFLKLASNISKKEGIIQSVNNQIATNVFKDGTTIGVSTITNTKDIDKPDFYNIRKNIKVIKFKYKDTNYLLFINRLLDKNNNEQSPILKYIYKNDTLIDENIFNLISGNVKKIGNLHIRVSYGFDGYNKESSFEKSYPFVKDEISKSKFSEILNKDKIISHNIKQAYFYNENIINFSVYLIAFIVIILMLYKDLKTDSKLFYKDINKSLYRIPVFFIAMFVVLNVVVDNILTEMQSLLKYEILSSVNQSSIELLLNDKLGILMVISAIIFAPFVEELVFRKAFVNTIKSKPLALYTSSLVFGLIHCLGETSPEAMVINLISYMSAGLILGGIYLFSKKNIYISIYVHLIWNAMSFLL